MLPSRLRFSPAAWTCPKGSQSVPGLGFKGSKAPHLPTDGLYPQGKAPALLSGPAQLLHPILTLLPPLGSPALIAPSQSGEMDWRGRRRVGRATAVGSPMGGAIYLQMDRVDGTRASTGKRQLPGTHQHRSFWGVSCVRRAHLTPTPRPHPAPRCPIALQRPIREKASGGV